MTGLKRNEGELSIKHILDRIKNISGILYQETDPAKFSKLSDTCCFCNNEISVHNIQKTSCNHLICNMCAKEKQDTCKECGVSLIENAIVSPNICKVRDYKIVLINSDYYIGFDINREKLYEILYRLELVS